MDDASLLGDEITLDRRRRSGRDKDQALTWQKREREEVVSRRRVGAEGLREEKADIVNKDLRS